MKKLLPILAFLLASVAGNAQHYNCFTPGINQYFVNDQGYVRGMRIDSIMFSGNDLLYYPFKTVRGNYYTSYLDSTGGSWLGGKVVKKPDGTFIFDNNWGDTVIIKTQAAPGDEWIFYSDSSTYYYKATVMSLDTMSFIGTTDSVKKITITAYDGLNINTNDSLHGFEIILSKSHGFVQVFDLYTFPYHPYNIPYQTGWDYFTDESIDNGVPQESNSLYRICNYYFVSVDHQYDKHVGDVYMYSQCSGSGSCTGSDYLFLDTIKHIYTSGNTLQYIQSGWTAAYLGQGVYSVAYHDSIPPPCNYCPEYEGISLMPEEHKQRFSWYYYPHDTSFCMNQPLYFFRSIYLNYESMTVQVFEAPGSFFKYKAGVGLIEAYSYHGGGSIIADRRELLYYDKNGATCGTYAFPDTTVPVAVNTLAGQVPLVNIYPNPATEECIISYQGDIKKTTVTIYDVSGRLIQSTLLLNANTTIPLSSYPSGVYHFRISIDGREFVYKKVVVVK